MPDIGDQVELSEDVAERALLERPSLGIRVRLTLGFLLFFFLSAAATLTVFYTVYKMERRLHFLELVDRYTFEIQQARRFEKNFFLYGTNLRDVLYHVDTGQDLLLSAREEIGSVIGEEKLRTLEEHLGRYRKLLVGLSALDHNRSLEMVPHHPRIEAELRKYGAEMVSVALNVARKERRAVERSFDFFKRLPIAFLCVLLVLVVVTTTFLAKQMLAPLSRLMETTQRIARGNFIPHMPHRRYKDEFTDLAIAINRMIHELELRQDELVQSRKIAAIGTLTSGIAHELNNPINNISITAESLIDDFYDLPDERKIRLIEDIFSQSERASQVVRNLLDFSRYESPSLELLSVAEVIDDTLKLVKNQMALSQISLRLEVPADLPCIQGNKRNLEQVFLNLLLNAIQAMSNGGAITIRAQSLSDGYLEVDVSDTGEGISQEDLAHIFDPFFSTKEVGRGTGLGLSVSYGIIKKHNGRIKVESEVGRGSTFSVYLPIAYVEAAVQNGREHLYVK